MRDAAQAAADTSSLHVLLLERDAQRARAEGLRLRMLGCRVSVAADSRHAVELALRERPDLVLARGDGNLRDRLAADPRTRAIAVVEGGE
jgi:hypothetical protein